MSSIQLEHKGLLRLVTSRLVIGIAVLFALVFLPSGTFAYWQGWVYLAILLIPMTFVMVYFLKNDPELLVRRMQFREKQAAQKRIIKLSYVYLLIVFLLPGLDYRFSWSNVTVAGILFADVLVLLGYILVFLVFRENRYASRIVQVEKAQQVITTGVYAIVRHPMYLGTIVMYIFSPLALGSYWAMIPAVLIIPLLVARIRNEESVLVRELKGYPEYMQQTKYRLVPGIW